METLTSILLIYDPLPPSDPLGHVPSRTPAGVSRVVASPPPPPSTPIHHPLSSATAQAKVTLEAVSPISRLQMQLPPRPSGQSGFI